MAAAPRTKLQFSISAVFALLILPALSAVIAFSYYENVRNLSEVAQRSIDRARDDAITMGANFFEPVAATLRLVAEVASGHPEFFRTQDSRDTLYAALISAPQIDAVYTSFEDGYHRVVTRMDDDRRRNNPRIPALANWHSSYIDAYAAGEDRARHRRFFEQWPRVIGGFTEPTTFRVETLPHFKAAQENLGIAVTEPIINPDTGSPVISMAYPKPLAPAVEPRFMTIFFSDLENFTTISEQLSPQDLSEQTSRYFEIVTVAVTEEQGTIDKFIGDSVMAFWGAPAMLDDHAYRACLAALKASYRMKRLNAEWANEGRRPMPIRIGIHSANVVVGNVGSPQRLSYTVMGDGVNVASRIEGLNKQFGTSICISESVYEQVASRVVARALGRVPVKGRETEIMVYELLGIAGRDDPELRAHQATV